MLRYAFVLFQVSAQISPTSSMELTHIRSSGMSETPLLHKPTLQSVSNILQKIPSNKLFSPHFLFPSPTLHPSSPYQPNASDVPVDLAPAAPCWSIDVPSHIYVHLPPSEAIISQEARPLPRLVVQKKRVGQRGWTRTRYTRVFQ